VKWHLPSTKPGDENDEMIFSDGTRYYIGKFGPGGNWYDNKSDEVFDELTGGFIPPNPIMSIGVG
jgi:hypothetical protein